MLVYLVSLCLHISEVYEQASAFPTDNQVLFTTFLILLYPKEDEPTRSTGA